MIFKVFTYERKNPAVQEKSSLGRKNNDRGWMSKCLTEDAKRYIDDFLSNVEDTDLILHYGESEAAGCSTRSTSHPVEMDGVVLPWLQWETGNDGSPLLCKSKEEVSHIPKDISYGSLQVHMVNDANILEAIQLINVDAARHHVLDSLHPFFTLNWSLIASLKLLPLKLKSSRPHSCIITTSFRGSAMDLAMEIVVTVMSKWSFECAGFQDV
ncbi:hypothetical protein IFM89_006605 [Coptis chinensis]|uniref:Uncharacterized protein n=1 Tax=Coptis chinensis TaxID=261450 RepID=A0A835I8J9_9MAGN|nr:hypothetical protein IFM89_006605 [Coptis chinensis]